MADLTKQQKLFVKEYLVDLNGTQAAIRAGYSKKTAQEQSSRLLSNVIIAQIISVELEKRAAKLELNAEWVLSNLKSVVERCMQAEAVRDNEGRVIGEYTFNAAGANKSLELIGKHIGMFGDTLHVKFDQLHFVENMQQYSKLMEGKYKVLGDS